MNPVSLLQLLPGIKHPIIMAPMFLVTNEMMMQEAQRLGIAGCIPALNFRKTSELQYVLERLKRDSKTPFGVNLIVNKSNIYLKEHLRILKDVAPAFIITSLGSPEEAIQTLKPRGVKVFCDVIDLETAKKVEKLGADALVAVNSGAGGHRGNIPSTVLVPLLVKETSLPVISAGGVGTGEGLLSMQALGACGISMGTPFIGLRESPVSEEYKKALVDYGAKDIVSTTKLSGTPCTVINTPYVKKIGVDQNPLEKVLSQNKKLKKYMKLLVSYRGLKALEKSAFSATYQTLWCAGPSLEFTEEIQDMETFLNHFLKQYEEASHALIRTLKGNQETNQRVAPSAQ